MIIGRQALGIHVNGQTWRRRVDERGNAAMSAGERHADLTDFIAAGRHESEQLLPEFVTYMCPRGTLVMRR